MVRLFIRTRTHDQLSGVTAVQHHTPPGLIVGEGNNNEFVLPGWSFSQNTAAPTCDVDRMYFVPIYLAREMTFGALAVDVTTAQAGSTVRLGIYEADISAAANLSPGALVDDAGTIDSSSTGDKVLAAENTLAAGYHFLVAVSDTASVILRSPKDSAFVTCPVMGHSGGVGNAFLVTRSRIVAGASSALPDPAPATNTTEGIGDCCVYLQV